MKHFINEYKYTSDIIKEAVSAWWYWKFDKGYKALSIVILILLILSILKKNFFFLLLEILPLATIVMIKLKTHLAIKLEKERVQVLFPNDAPIFHVEIGASILCKTERSNSHVSFSEIEKIIETKNLIVIMMKKGAMSVSLNKNGFIEVR